MIISETCRKYKRSTEKRLDVWARQPTKSFEQATLGSDKSLAGTTGKRTFS